MRRIFIIGLVVLLYIAGCAKSNRPAFSSESVECQRLDRFWKDIEADKIKTIALFGEDSNEPIEEVTLEEAKEGIFLLTGCCCPMPHPLASEWKEYNRLECIRQYLESEQVQRIAFYGFQGELLDEEREKPEDWGKPWADITEPKRIKEVLMLLYKAMDTEKDRFSNEVSPTMPMQMITNKYKFIIPVSDYNDAICGIGWTSQELRKKLNQWGFSR